VDRGSDREAKGRSRNLADYAYGVQWDCRTLRNPTRDCVVRSIRRTFRRSGGRSFSAPFGQLSAVFFDLDGTLIESEEVWNDAVRRLARDRGAVATDELLAKTHGLDSHRAMRLIHESLSWPADQVEHHVAWVAGAVADTMRDGVIWRPGAVAWFPRCAPPVCRSRWSRRAIGTLWRSRWGIRSGSLSTRSSAATRWTPETASGALPDRRRAARGRRAPQCRDRGLADGRGERSGAGCAVLYVSEATTSPDVDATRKSLVGVDLAMLVKLLVEAGRIP